MQIGLDAGDRKLLLVSGSVLLVLLGALAFFAPLEGDDPGFPSTYSAHSHGAKAAFLLLQNLGYKVERWEKSPADLPTNAQNTVLVLAAPARFPDKDDRRELQRYLATGGKILAVGYNAGFFIPQQHVSFLFPNSAEWKRYSPQAISPLTRGGDIQMAPSGYWASDGPAEMRHYGEGDQAMVISYPVGKGEVIWWGGDTPLTNAGISASGNLELLLNSIGDPGKVHVFWDEYFHGSSGGLAAYMAAPPIKYGLLQCGIIFIAFLFTFARRNAPLRPLSDQPRLSPLEFVQTLGGLYRRASAPNLALEVSYARFRYLLTRRLGLKPGTDPAVLARAVRERLGYKGDSFPEFLEQLEHAVYDYELRESKALDLVRQLGKYSEELKLIPQIQQEKP